jgi:hypothetical protein
MLATTDCPRPPDDLPYRQRGVRLEEDAMNGIPTVLVLVGLRIVLPIMALLAIGTFLDRRQTSGM